MLKAAVKSGETLPALVVCNVDWDSMEQAGLSDGQQQIQSAFGNIRCERLRLCFKREM